MGGTSSHGQRLADRRFNVPSVNLSFPRVLASLLLGLSLVALSGCGGSKHSAKPPESTPASLAPNSIAFWDAEHGLVGSGITWKKTTGAISATSDGGKTFHVVLRTPEPVVWVSVVADTQNAWAQLRSSRLLHSSDYGRTWRTLPRSSPQPLYPNIALTVVQPRCPNLRGPCPVPAVLSLGLATTTTGRLLKTWNGGQTWKVLPSPGSTLKYEWGAPLGPTYLSLTSRHAWALRVGQGSAGSEPKTVFESADGGKSWRMVADQPVVGHSRVGSGGLASYGYPQGISFSPQGTGLLWESRGNLYGTRDGGHRWQKLAVAEPEVDSGLSAVMLSRTGAFVLLMRPDGYRLLTTTDGGESWSIVHRWAAAR